MDVTAGPATTKRPRSIEQAIAPLQGLPQLIFEQLGPFDIQGQKYFLPKFIFRRPGGGNEPIRIGIFATIHGDEPAGTDAVIQFLQQIAADPDLAEDYSIHAYPVCNPTGFEDGTRASRRGKDLNREFWKNSSEAEVRLLEHELHTRHFQGIIQLHADDTSDGIYGFVRGHTLTENLLRPALAEAGKILPRNVNAQIDGFAARDGIIYELYEGVLGAPEKIQPEPFEIVFETPGHAVHDLQVGALVVALRTILTEYRRLISFAQDI